MENNIIINEKVEEKHNFTIDIFKFIFAIFVILVHFPLPGEVGTICSTIGVTGVIFFFLISGYYAYNQDDSIACKNLMKRFKRNLILTFIVILIYFVVVIIENIISGDIASFFDNFKNPMLYLRMVLLGDFSFIRFDAVWFMFNLLYSYLILFVLHKLHITKYSYFVLPLLIIARIVVEVYVNTYNADWHYTSFVLSSGLPIILLGHFIAYKKEFFKNISTVLSSILLGVSILLMFLTVYVKLFEFRMDQVFKIWAMFELFIIVIKYPGAKELFVSCLGKKYSMYIYLFHLLIGLLILDLIYLTGWTVLSYDYLFTAIVIIVSILVSVLIYEIRNLIKKRIAKRKQGINTRIGDNYDI